MSAAKPIELVSVEDYLAGEAVARHKHEYVGGRIYAMAGAVNRHNRIAGAFYGAMYNQLRGRPCQPCTSDTKVRVRLSLSHTRFYYPDGMVVCDPNPAGDAFEDRPVVIVEVLSNSTRRVDEGEKRDAYLTIPTLAAYLMVEQNAQRVVAYERAGNGGFVARVYEGPEAAVPLDAVGTALPLAELYERVDLSAPPDDDDEPADVEA